MNLLRKLSLAGLGVVAFAHLAAAQATPVEAVRSFYTAYSRTPFTGLPTGAAWRRIAPRISTPFAKLITAAQAKQGLCKKAHPDDKPLWVEGDMFSSNFEGFTRFKVIDSAAATGARQPVIVAFDYVSGGKTFSWRDKVILINEKGHWLIDDVVYSQHEGFGNGFGESLRKSLAFKDAC